MVKTTPWSSNMKKIIFFVLVATLAVVAGLSKSKEVIALECNGTRDVKGDTSRVYISDDKVTMVISTDYYPWQEKNYKITFGGHSEKFNMYFSKRFNIEGDPGFFYSGSNFKHLEYVVDDRDMVFTQQSRITAKDDPLLSKSENDKRWFTSSDYQKVIFDRVSKQMKFVISNGYINIDRKSQTYHEIKFDGQCKEVK
jgi:hypothetical protein